MIVVVIVLVVALMIVVMVAVGRDPGADPTDVAIGYARAAGHGDFDAMYRMIDPDLLAGRNRPDWIARQRAVPYPTYPANPVRAVTTVVRDDTARVDVAVEADRVVPIELVLRQRVWTVASFAGTPVVDSAAR